MKFLKPVIGLLLAAAMSLHATPLPAAALDYQLVWSDEFDGVGVDPSKWVFQIGDGCPALCGWGNNELEYYRSENAIVSGGLLTITARFRSTREHKNGSASVTASASITCGSGGRVSPPLGRVEYTQRSRLLRLGCEVHITAILGRCATRRDRENAA